MPRRTTPLLPSGRLVIAPRLTHVHRRAIARCIRKFPSTAKLGRAAQCRLKQAIFLAVRYARIGLSHWLTGRRAKPLAWTLDVLTFDLMNAWRTAGLRPTIRVDSTGKSAFLEFTNALAEASGLQTNRASLFHNALRAMDIQREA